MKRFLLLALLVLFASVPAFAVRTFYIDYVGGSDSNSVANAQSKTTPWKTHPRAAGSTVSGYTHTAGDRFIFKGGVTWPAAAGRIVLASGDSGNSTNSDYYGVDQTWYTGGSWTRPILDGEYTLSGLIGIQTNSYVTIDNLEGKRALEPGTGYCIFGADDGIGLLFSNCYVHGWRTSNASDGNHGGIIIGSFKTDPLASIIDNCEIENSENSTYTGNGNGPNGNCASRIGTIRNGSKIHDNCSGVLFCLDFNGSQLYNITGNTWDGVTHTNGIYLDAQTFGNAVTVAYIRNSFLHDCTGGANTAYLNPRGASLYCYNNVIYGQISDQQPIEIDVGAYGTETAGSVYVYNDTVTSSNSAHYLVHHGDRVFDLSSPNQAFRYNYPGGHYRIASVGTTDFTLLGAANNNVGTVFTSNSTAPSGTGTVRSYLQNLVVYNNHGIGLAGLSDTSAPLSISYTNGTNLLQPTATATGQAYTAGNLYAPTSGGSTIDAGTSESGTFTTDILGATRTGTWDIGAYEYQGASDTTPPTPNPSTIASTAVLGTTSYSVTATTSTDATTPPVQYRFSKDGGSTWTAYQSSATYTFTGLTAATGYSTQVQAEDSAGTPNVTTASGSTTVTTDAIATATPKGVGANGSRSRGHSKRR